MNWWASHTPSERRPPLSHFGFSRRELDLGLFQNNLNQLDWGPCFALNWGGEVPLAINLSLESTNMSQSINAYFSILTLRFSFVRICCFCLFYMFVDSTSLAFCFQSSRSVPLRRSMTAQSAALDALCYPSSFAQINDSDLIFEAKEKQNTLFQEAWTSVRNVSLTSIQEHHLLFLEQWSVLGGDKHVGLKSHIMHQRKSWKREWHEWDLTDLHWRVHRWLKATRDRSCELGRKKYLYLFDGVIS